MAACAAPAPLLAALAALLRTGHLGLRLMRYGR